MPFRDVYKKVKAFNDWKKNITDSYIEKGLTKENSKHLVDFILWLEQRNRTERTLYENKNKISRIMVLFQERGFEDISKVKEEDVLKFFSDWRKQGHTDDYIKRFKAFWNFWTKVNRKKGIAVIDVIQDLQAKDGESKFVWVTKEQLDKLCEYLNPEEQLCVRFCFDSLLRFPSEAFGITAGDISQNAKGEVWVIVPKDICGKNTFTRKFNLVYTGQMILNHIKEKNLKDSDFLFSISSEYFNWKIQKIARQLWDTKKSDGGEYFKKITGYDFRHSGSIHFRQLFQKTGQSLDSLRHRGGWTDFKMINYYTKLLGLDGHIDKEKTLLQEDRTKLEKEVQILRQGQKEVRKKLLEGQENVKKAIEGLSFVLEVMKNGKSLKNGEVKIRKDVLENLQKVYNTK